MKKPIKQKTVVEQLVHELREMIINGSYKENDRFPTEQELSERFGVSRTSVREALKTLSYLGILESQTSRGTRVSFNNRIVEEAASWAVMLSYNSMYDVFVLGSALDTQVAIIVYNKIRRDPDSQARLISDMDAIIANMKGYAAKNDVKKFEIAFSEYFSVLYEASDNTVIIALNNCIDSLITKKTCKAYYETDQLMDATEALEAIWLCAKEGTMEGAIAAVQNYGNFAANTFRTFDPDLLNDAFILHPPED